MEFSEYIQLLRQKKQTLVSVIILFLIFALIITFLQPFRYSANTKLLVFQEAPAGVDPYQVSKANNYISEVLANIVNANSFLSQVLESGYDINGTYFPPNQEERLEKWSKTVSADSGSGSGIVNISVFHPDKLQADQIARAINQVMLENHQQYHGGGEMVSIKVINEPYTSNLPTKPNVPLNLGLGLAIGFMVGASYIYLFPESSYNLRLFPGSRRKKKEAPTRLSGYSDGGKRPEKRGGSSQQPATAGIDNNNRHWRPVEQGSRQDVYEEDELDYDEIVRRGSINNVFK